MKTFVLCAISAAVLCAQVQIQSGQIPRETISPETVIAKIDGHDLTFAEFQKMMQEWPPQLTAGMQQSPADALRQIYTIIYLGGQAEKQKLDQEDPLKGQLAAMRLFMLAQAGTTYDRNHFPVSEDDIKKYYEKNKSHFAQAKIRVIKIGLQEPIPLGSDAVQKAAQIAAQNARFPHRSEAEASALAADILKKLRSGGDFAALAKQYSDDDSKTKGGEFGTVTATSAYPDEMKSAIFALKAGGVSEPVRQPNSLYIIRVDEITYPPVDKLNSEIIGLIRDQHLHDVAVELGKRFQPQLIHPEAFLPPGRPPQAK